MSQPELTEAETALLGKKPIERLKNEWADKNGLKQVYTQRCENLVRGVRENGFCKEVDHVTGLNCNDDHLSFWNKSGKPWGMVSQPYHLTLSNLKAIVERAERCGHGVLITASEAWHWPGHVLFVEFRIRGGKD